MFHARALMAVVALGSLGGCSSRTSNLGQNSHLSTTASESNTHSTLPDAALDASIDSGISDGGHLRPDAAPASTSPDIGDGGHDDNLVVRVGVPDPVNPLAFTPIPDDGHIKIRMGGQGGTHAMLGLQCSGFGNRILYEIRIDDIQGGGYVSTPPLPAPRPIICDMAGVCKLVPINVVLGGLAPPEQWPGMEVAVTLTVSNADGLSATANATGVLDPT